MKRRRLIAASAATIVLISCSGTSEPTLPTTVLEVEDDPNDELDDATAEFCDEGANVLVDDSIGDDPKKMRLQMETLTQAASDLPDEAQLTLMQHVEPLLAELHLAERERSVGGWSSTEVVEFVGDLCGRDDLVAWIVQP